ncbi:MAG: adenosylcobalamin-dependent ribonucleoside-diphosphate reductase [bacterium]|nr:adenosylcobalamin-dependent ribonucleoside-diphosphate reductase [bacterium]
MTGVAAATEPSPLRYHPDGMKFPRYFTKAGVDPYAVVHYDRRSSVIRETDGREVFRMDDVEVPSSWSQVATDILAQKYFRKTGVPQLDENGETKRNSDGSVALGPERSVKQVVHRLAGCWRYWGERYGYFATAEDAQAFYDEVVFMLLTQRAAPNSPQWFNTGLHWAYQINSKAQGHSYLDPDTGTMTRAVSAYEHPQPHACFIQAVNDDLVNEGGIMDLWVREARLFKYGSGTGTNFSSLRGSGERLSGGGKSSGLKSWLKIGDAAAAGIKSGGTTRRAAKMVILDIDHPDVEWFINWKAREEKKVAAMVAAGYDSAYEGEAYQTVSGQNSNNSVRLPNNFVKAVLNDQPWELKGRIDPSANRTIKARELWDQIANAAWACADPGVQFDTTINEWGTCPQSGKIRATNPCSEYVFLDNTACNLASINLALFFDTQTKTFDIPGFTYATRLWTTILEISVLMSASPSREIADGTYNYRTLGLGYANLGAVLMTSGIPYDSPEALGFAGAVTALMTGVSYRTSAEMAKFLGTFPEFTKNRGDMLRVIRNHRRAAYNAKAEEYEGLTVTPMGIEPTYAPAHLLTAARKAWDEALSWGEQHGYRNAQTTLLAPTGTIGLLMDCSTTGVEPDFALVKFKKLAGGGYFKIVNEAVPVAISALGYTESQMNDITAYLRGRGTLNGAPHVNPQTLNAKGLTDAEIAKVETALKAAFALEFVFTATTLSDATLQRLGFTPAEYGAPGFNLLSRLGFTPEQLQEANEYVCGTMTIENAPHLKAEHEAVFDCANKCGANGKRYIHFMGHVRMLAAVQPFLSGSISKTINMPNEATVAEVEQVYMESWRLCLKCLSIYRDGCKLSQPLATSAKGTGKKSEAKAETAAAPAPVVPAVSAPAAALVAAPVATVAELPKSSGRRVFLHGEKRELPYKRGGITVEAEITGHKVFLRTGEYPDGSLGEIFIDMYKEGAAYRSIMNSFAVAVSTALKYGVPLEKLINKFTFTRFEPSGPTSHPNVKFCTSVLDFIFRVLAMEYLGRTDLVQVPPTGVQKNRAAQLAALAVHQQTMELPNTPTTTATAAAVSNDPGSAASMDVKVDTSQVNSFLGQMMGDAPLCDTCGHVMIRNASCYKCLNCGSTSGCS